MYIRALSVLVEYWIQVQLLVGKLTKCCMLIAESDMLRNIKMICVLSVKSGECVYDAYGLTVKKNTCGSIAAVNGQIYVYLPCILDKCFNAFKLLFVLLYI